MDQELAIDGGVVPGTLLFETTRGARTYQRIWSRVPWGVLFPMPMNTHFTKVLTEVPMPITEGVQPDIGVNLRTLPLHFLTYLSLYWFSCFSICLQTGLHVLFVMSTFVLLFLYVLLFSVFRYFAISHFYLKLFTWHVFNFTSCVYVLFLLDVCSFPEMLPYFFM